MSLAPLLMEDAPKPVRLMAPELPVRFRAPELKVKPLLAVNVWETVKAPELVVVIPPLPIVMAVALPAPSDRAPRDRASKLGDCRAVPKIPVPERFRLPVCWVPGVEACSWT